MGVRCEGPRDAPEIVLRLFNGVEDRVNTQDPICREVALERLCKRVGEMATAMLSVV
jgi:hypothetical protein